jgi:predicted dehydrogenase/nucleoside-diphosphate-sugar epimerase
LVIAALVARSQGSHPYSFNKAMNAVSDISKLASSTAPLKLALLGAGAVVSEYYIPALRLLNLLQHTTIVDSAGPLLTETHERYPDLNTAHSDFRDFLTSSNRLALDALIVALPNALHEEASALALRHGLHVLCEKPLALTHAACFRLAKQSEANHRVLAVGMVRRLLPSICALREALSQNLIGELIGVDIEDGSPYLWLSDSGAPFQPENGGVLADMGIHYLDLVQCLVSDLAPFKYRDDACGGVEANLEFHLRTQSDVPVRLALSRTHHLRNTAIFRGQRGELIVEKNCFDCCIWKPDHGGYRARLFATRPFSNANWPLTFESCFAEQLFRFARSVRGEENDYVSVSEAARGVKLIEWAYQHRSPPKAHRGGKPSERPKLSVAPVIVTGGTGFIGTNLVNRLNELGFNQITVALRTYRTSAVVARFRVNTHRVNLLDRDEVNSAVQGARYVFHLAYGQDGPQPARVTIEGTRNIVEAAIAQHVESIYVFGCPDTEREIDETWPYAAIGGEYGESKAVMEKWCLKRARYSDYTRIIILNPSCVYGPFGKTYTQTPVQLARECGFCWIEGGQGAANYAYVDNVVDAILLAAQTRQAHAHRFIINDGTTTWREFLRPLLGSYGDALPSYTKKQLQDFYEKDQHVTLLDAVRVIASRQEVVDVLKRAPLFRLPLQLAARHSPGTLEKIRKLRARPLTDTPLSNGHRSPPVWLADLFPDSRTVFSAEKARRLLNWKPSINLERGQELTVEWLRSINLI